MKRNWDDTFVIRTTRKETMMLKIAGALDVLHNSPFACLSCGAPLLTNLGKFMPPPPDSTISHEGAIGLSIFLSCFTLIVARALIKQRTLNSDQLWAPVGAFIILFGNNMLNHDFMLFWLLMFPAATASLVCAEKLARQH